METCATRLERLRAQILGKGAFMWVRRSGSTKSHGWSTIIQPHKPQIVWDKENNILIIQARREPDIHQHNVKYDYDIILSLEDVANLVITVAGDGIAAMPRKVHEAFRLRLPQLARLAACAAGSNPIPLHPTPVVSTPILVGKTV